MTQSFDFSSLVQIVVQKTCKSCMTGPKLAQLGNLCEDPEQGGQELRGGCGLRLRLHQFWMLITAGETLRQMKSSCADHRVTQTIQTIQSSGRLVSIVSLVPVTSEHSPTCRAHHLPGVASSEAVEAWAMSDSPTWEHSSQCRHPNPEAAHHTEAEQRP